MTNVIPWLTEQEEFPPVARALLEPNGLLAAGGGLAPERLLAAYRLGIFPWYSGNQPVLWWSPDPRMVLFPAEFRMPRSLGKRLRRHDYEIRIDSAFTEVMHGCALPRSDGAGTWITQDMIDAYYRLHQLGYAHSIETWIDGKLAGGLYGMAIGRAFFGESMFARVSDASKIAFAHLVHQLARWQFGMIDCQMNTAHLARFGAREIPRTEFSQNLTELVNYPSTTISWQFEDDLFK
jgi:leucyl/phenylalanyl-tRNA--protein transferase